MISDSTFGGNALLPSNSGQTSQNTLNRYSDELLVLHVDVGQGESTILIERSGTTPLWCCIIDGGFGAPGRGALIRYLIAFEIRVVDLVICSHFDGDHTKGLTELLKHHAISTEQSAEVGKPFIRKLLVRNANPKKKKSSTKIKLLNAAKAKKIPCAQAKAEAVDIRPARSGLSCLHANSAELQDENEGSLAFRLQFGKFSYYTAGDLPSEKEEDILIGIGIIDAFKCGHHGSANSTPDTFLASTEPLAAFISCGRNSYGHPTFDVIERLCAEKSPVQTIYLTNCIHNRRCVSQYFDGDEHEILSSYFKIESMSGLDPEDFEDSELIYNLKAIEKAIQACDPGKAKSEQERLQMIQRQRVLRAMRRAAEHERKEGLEERQIGRVAGNEESLGTIVLHVPYRREDSEDPGIFHVGLLEELPDSDDTSNDDTFTWYRHCRGKRTRRVDDIDDYEHEDALDDIYSRLSTILAPAKLDPQELDLFRKPLDFEELRKAIQKNIEKSRDEEPRWDYDLMEAPGTPKNYETHVLHRRDEYARFSVPTVIGLSARKTKTPYIPFCAACSLDFDPEDPDFELVSVMEEGEDDFVHFHRFCFHKLFVGKGLEVTRLDEGSYQELTREDIYDLDEIVICDFDSEYNDSLDKAWTQYIRSRFLEAVKQIKRNTCRDDKDYLSKAITAMKLSKKDSDSDSDFEK